jgi:hypothetical protein
MEDKEREHICDEDTCELNEPDAQHTNLCCCCVMDEADAEDPCYSADENECCC